MSTPGSLIKVVYAYVTLDIVFNATLNDHIKEVSRTMVVCFGVLFGKLPRNSEVRDAGNATEMLCSKVGP